jgi:hypothetical protein
MPLVDNDGELHFAIPRSRGDGRRPAIDRFIDLYHMRSTDGRTQWTEPQRIFEGYLGAIQCLVQLQSGRIIAPFADWIAGRPTAPPTGPSVTTAIYSDDGGRTWMRSPARLTSPCYEGYNGGNYGACEPTILELEDGRVWMIIRTQTGFLYESFSEDGVNWSEAKPSRFPSSNSPAFPIRLPDGRIVLFWNNCEMPPRVGQDGVYGGRDALHAAISDDEGETWRGFREVYRDATRNGSPSKTGDRGTAYPHATLTPDGRILLVSGQGAERRRRLLIDPDWLLETRAEETFSNLDAWHVFKGFGPAKRWWRDRVQGPQLVAHPNKSGEKALHVRRPDNREGDGAAWNFPAGRNGKLTLRLRIEKDFGGAQISLADRFFNPCDDNGERKAPFALAICPNGRIANNTHLEPGRWYTLDLQWTSDGKCRVALDAQPTMTLTARNPAPNGVSYLRLRSLAKSVDTNGFLVASVKVEVL